jgi:hypothetical protein
MQLKNKKEIEDIQNETKKEIDGMQSGGGGERTEDQVK